MSNYSVKSILNNEFMKNTNPHKYAKLWASKFYKIIAKIMRNYDIVEIKNSYPYSFFYISNFIKYFYTHGYYKKDLLEHNVKYLYRGLTNDFKFGNYFDENSFMSTSWKFKIAEGFAKSEGNILIFFLINLPDNLPFVIIDSNIAEELNESEIVFLPYGKIKTKLIQDEKIIKNLNSKLKKYNDIKYYNSFFSCNLNKIKYYMDNKFSGGNKNKEKYIDFYSYIYELLEPFENDIPKYTLNNKLFIFYRAIINRPVEIFTQLLSPKDDLKLHDFLKFTLDKQENYYNIITNMIPEVQDIHKIKSNLTGLEFKKMNQQLNSYNFYIAVYDPEKKEILDLRYGMFNFMNEECGITCDRDNEIKQVIIDEINKQNEEEIIISKTIIDIDPDDFDII